MNARDRFLNACFGKPVDATPVWFMRQAGRYLPEYRRLRKDHTILELATDPHLATEVALQPLRVLDVDAAILFADIVLPLRPMGADVDLPDNVGPVVAKPVRTLRDVEALSAVDVEKELAFVLETIRMIRERLEGERAVIGFSGAPFTLASYLVEGGASKEFAHVKRFMHSEPEAWRLLMEKLTQVVADYLRAQAAAGADALQLFDSWAGHLSPNDYEELVAPYSRRVVAALDGLGVPRIHFATPSAGVLEQVRNSGAEVVGVDWRLRMGDARARLGPGVAVQGNLDPGVLASSWDATERAARSILKEVGGAPGHIFNLGHGILPSTPVENAARLVDLVHVQTRRRILEATP